MEVMAAGRCLVSRACKTGSEHSANSSFLRTCSPGAPRPTSAIPQGEELSAWDTVTHSRPGREVINKLGFGPKSGCAVPEAALSWCWLQAQRPAGGSDLPVSCGGPPSISDQSPSLSCRAPKAELPNLEMPLLEKRRNGGALRQGG